PELSPLLARAIAEPTTSPATPPQMIDRATSTIGFSEPVRLTLTAAPPGRGTPERSKQLRVKMAIVRLMRAPRGIGQATRERLSTLAREGSQHHEWPRSAAPPRAPASPTVPSSGCGRPAPRPITPGMSRFELPIYA